MSKIFMRGKIYISHPMEAHLCGLQERVEQTTRELESSVREPAGSSGSSRSSSPLLYNGVSYEDIGGGGSGLEMEEVPYLLRLFCWKKKIIFCFP